ncbi:MAG: preprotein translocase subunit SecE [Actinobacteria bacterium]|nr:MAG: preprotein translocase subunit SecE [Actinomycetota bacterium]
MRTEEDMAKATTADTKQGKKATGVDKPAKVSKPTKVEKPNIFTRFMNYLKAVRAEMQRVVWPTRTEVVNSVMVVIVTLLFFFAFTGVFDIIVIQVLKLVDQIPSPF